MRVFLIVILTIISFHLAAQHSYLPSVKTLATKDGLSSNVVNAIHKDDRGFIWIGTEYGLNRYDGQEFDFFSKDNEEYMTIDAVHKIADDGQGYLWVMKTHERYDHDYSHSELNIFDISSSKAIDVDAYFEEDLPFEIKHITLLKQLDNKTLLIHILKDKKAYTFRKGEGFKDFPIPKEFHYVRDAFQLPAGDFLVSGYDVSAENTIFYKVSNSGKNFQKIDDLRFDITSNGVVQSFEASFWTLSAYYHLGLNTTVSPTASGIYPSLIQAIYDEKVQLSWLREETQMSVINQKRQVIFELPYQSVETGIKPLPILFDGENTWFSDGINGIQVITLKPNYFENVIPFSQNKSNSMRGIYVDKNSDTWFSTIKDIGIKHKNGQTTILNGNIRGWFTSLLEDKSGNIWRGSTNQLCKHNLSSNTVQCYEPATEFGNFWSLYEANNGNIWIAKDDTIIVFNPTTETFQAPITLGREFKETFNIYAMQTSVLHPDRVWICTNKGLYLCDETGNIIATYHDQQEGEFYLPANDFYHMYQLTYSAGREENGTIWLATGDGGLISWQFAPDSYRD